MKRLQWQPCCLPKAAPQSCEHGIWCGLDKCVEIWTITHGGWRKSNRMELRTCNAINPYFFAFSRNGVRHTSILQLLPNNKCTQIWLDMFHMWAIQGSIYPQLHTFTYFCAFNCTSTYANKLTELFGSRIPHKIIWYSRTQVHMVFFHCTSCKKTLLLCLQKSINMGLMSSYIAT